MTYFSSIERAFLDRLIANGGKCNWEQLPARTKEENVARQFCRRHDFARFQDGYWQITEVGKAMRAEDGGVSGKP